MRIIINVGSLCNLKYYVKCPNAVTTCETNIIYIQNMNKENFSLLSFMLVDARLCEGWFVVSICLAEDSYKSMGFKTCLIGVRFSESITSRLLLPYCSRAVEKSKNTNREIWYIGNTLWYIRSDRS